jgi:ribonuclease BN (tRNA processing enzyme)
MKLTWLGTGGFFTLSNFHSNALIENDNGKALLIDCGTDIRHSLAAFEKDPANIDTVFISHLHGDHAGGLEWLGFYTYFVTKTKPTIYHPGTALYSALWDHLLAAGMAELSDKKANFLTYFESGGYKDWEQFIWEGIQFDEIPVLHVINEQEPVH